MTGPAESGAAAAGGRGVRLAARVLATLDRVVGALATLALAALIAIVFANVVGRYFFGRSLVWAEEAGIWLFVSIVFLGLPLAQRAGLHLSLTLLVAALPPRPRRAAALLADAVQVFVTLMLLFAGLEIMRRIGGTSPALLLPVWLKFLFLPLGCAASLLCVALGGLERGRAPWRGPLALLLGALLWLLVQGLPPGVLTAALPGVPASLVMGLAFLAALALGVPVAFALLFGVFLAGLGSGLLPPAAAAQTLVNGVGRFLLLAIPFFLAAGALMNAGGLTRRLLDFAFALVGHLRGGHAQVSVVSSLLYGGVSGSSYAEAALSAKLLVPQMLRHGYGAPFACAVTAASAVLPNLVPPSIALLILAAAANLSVGALWLAAVGPALLVAACLMLAVRLLAGRQRAAAPRAGAGEIARCGLHALPVLALALLVVAGLRFGVVTPTEAGVLAVAYALVLGLGVYREYGLRGLAAALRRAALEAALVGLLIGAAAPFAFVLAAEQLPQAAVAALGGLAENPLLLLLLINLALLLFGMILDIGAAILILTPLLLPLAVAAGVDPVHFGVVVVVNLMLGGLTPPVGMLAFVAASVSGTPVHAVFRALLPFLGFLLLALLLVTYLPSLSLGLLRLIG